MLVKRILKERCTHTHARADAQTQGDVVGVESTHRSVVEERSATFLRAVLYRKVQRIHQHFVTPR